MKTKLGHVHLKVRDLDEAVTFYASLLGLKVTERVGRHYAFLSFGEAHHDLALQALGPNAAQPSRHSVGLYHVAFEAAAKADFAALYLRLREAGISSALVDHRISWAMYFEDPDGNGLEIYTDTRHELEGRDDWQGSSLPLTSTTVLTHAEHAPRPAAGRTT